MENIGMSVSRLLASGKTPEEASALLGVPVQRIGGCIVVGTLSHERKVAALVYALRAAQRMEAGAREVVA